VWFPLHLGHIRQLSSDESYKQMIKILDFPLLFQPDLFVPWGRTTVSLLPWMMNNSIPTNGTFHHCFDMLGEDVPITPFSAGTLTPQLIKL